MTIMIGATIIIDITTKGEFKGVFLNSLAKSLASLLHLEDRAASCCTLKTLST